MARPKKDVEFNKEVKRVSLDSDGPVVEVLNKRAVTRDNMKLDNMDDWEAEMEKKRNRMIQMRELEADMDELFYKRRDKLNRELRVSAPKYSAAKGIKKWNPEFANERINTFLEDCEKLNAIPSLRSFELYIPSKYPGETFSRKTAARYIKEYETIEAIADEDEKMTEIIRSKDGYSLGALFYQLRTIGEDNLVSGGLTGRYNAQTTKFLLSAEHGMTEKSEIVSTGSVEMIFVNDLDSEEIELAERPEVSI